MDMEKTIAIVLRAGALISVFLFAAGLLSGANPYVSGLFFEAGLFVLVATPVTRVLLSVLMFAAERNALYTAITLIVLVNLLIAIFVVPVLMRILS